MNARRRFRELYYITHVSNLDSILEHGILSHAGMEAEGIAHKRVYDPGVVEWRRKRKTGDGKSLWEYANLYVQPRNPMLYKILQRKDAPDLVILGVDVKVAGLPGVWIADGNAARSETRFRKGPVIPKEVREMVDREWWAEVDSTKRRIMAEVLVPGRIPPEYIRSVYVPNAEMASRVRKIVGSRRIEVVPEPHMFFLPHKEVRLTGTPITLIEGDMFFSRMQTLTISVNTVGVMGKGLASRVKFQFPDAYVAYQEACKRKELRPGVPYLYKRELSMDSALMESPEEGPYSNHNTWFLFFPTKRHWRERSRLDDIEKGLQWVVENAVKLGMESLATPALGCGLGGLEWSEVGPMMCRYLSKIGIPVKIYLPLERSVPDEQLKPEFLLG